MEPWIKELVNYGVLGIFAIFIGALLWRNVPKLVDAHVDFLDHTKKCSEENAKVNVSVNDTLRALSSASSQNKHHCGKIDNTNAAITHLANAAQVLIGEHPQFEKAAPHIKLAIHALREKPDES